MDKLDSKILNILQQEFPLHTSPYLLIAQKLGISEQDLLDRIASLESKGIIRRIGAILDAKKMGFYSTLCSAHVPEERLKEVVGIINRYENVTHNYLRNHHMNIWFTLTASSYEKALSILEEIEDEANIKIYTMPAKRVYKIKATMEMS